MRYGRVTKEQLARMAQRADAAGQLGLAVTLYTVAATIDEAGIGLPRTVPDHHSLAVGLAIDLSADGRAKIGAAVKPPAPL
jgi:hypothetical protein